jgi:hypothetical protein
MCYFGFENGSQFSPASVIAIHTRKKTEHQIKSSVHTSPWLSSFRTVADHSNFLGTLFVTNRVVSSHSLGSQAEGIIALAPILVLVVIVAASQTKRFIISAVPVNLVDCTFVLGLR